MKNLLFFLLTLFLAITLNADTITFSSPSPGVIHYAATGTVAPVAMALNVDADGTITAVAVDSFFDIYMDAAHDMELAEPGSYNYGEGTPIANQDTVGEAVLPLSSFCISMGGLGGEVEPIDPAPMTGDIMLISGTATSVTITENALRGGVVGTDGEPMIVTGLPLTVEPIEPECFDSSHPHYAEWLDAGKPECWCYKYQCHGDADGLELGGPKTGYFWVYYSDITMLSANWQVFGDSAAKGDYPAGDGICADFDRREIGNSKDGYFRVEYADLTILAANWMDTSTDTVRRGDDPYPHNCGGEQ